MYCVPAAGFCLELRATDRDFVRLIDIWTVFQMVHGIWDRTGSRRPRNLFDSARDGRAGTRPNRDDKGEPHEVQPSQHVIDCRIGIAVAPKSGATEARHMGAVLHNAIQSKIEPMQDEIHNPWTQMH